MDAHAKVGCRAVTAICVWGVVRHCETNTLATSIYKAQREENGCDKYYP